MALPAPPKVDRSEFQRFLAPRASDGSGSIADSLTLACRWVLVGIAVIAVVLGLLNVYLLLILRPPSLRYAAGEQAVTFADAAMIERQSALRGYLLTRDASFLAAYRQAGATLAGQNNVASHDLGAEPKVAGLLQAMRRAQDGWTTQWAVPTIDTPPGSPAGMVASLDRGRVLFDAYRASEQALVRSVEREREILSRRGGYSLAIMLVVILLAGSSLMVITVIERRRFRSILLAPLSEILATTDRIANHDLAARARVEGPDEFPRIAGAVNQMAAGLKGFQERLAEENEQILAEMQGRVALEERTFLARELHDSISQILFSMTLQTRAAELTLQKEGLDPDGLLAHHLTRMRELTNGALAEMRALIFELRPGALREEGLVAALRKQAAGIAAREEFAVEVEAPKDLIDFDPITEEQLYRIGQEALHNVMKHAGAGRVRIRLVAPGGTAAPGTAEPGTAEPGTAAPAAPSGEFVLEISDDGCGFDPAIRRPGHMGLQTMSQRARRIGGWLEVESTPGEGTTVRVRVVPRRNPAEDPGRRAAATATQ
jgi:signal transduction histidine kinase